MRLMLESLQLNTVLRGCAPQGTINVVKQLDGPRRPISTIK